MTEHSLSETSSNEETQPSQEDQLRYMLDWHAAILAVLLEEAGGVVEIQEEDLLGINLSQATADIRYDEEKKVYRVERVVADES